MSDGKNLPLPVFYARTLSALIPLFDDSLSPSSPSFQSTLADQLDNLYLISRMITSLGVFSDNETVEELGDREMVFMTLGWVIGEAEGKAGVGGMAERKKALERSEAALNTFLALLSSYKILSPEEEAEGSAMAAGPSGGARDPARRREAKIRQYKREKELRQQIASQCRGQPDSAATPLTYLLSLLPQSSGPGLMSTSQPAASSSTSVNPESSSQRSLITDILRLLHTLALSSVASIASELEILSSIPNDDSRRGGPSVDPREASRAQDDATWRLDRTPGQYRPRELISGGGRVLRPFTILPRTMGLSERERLRGEVFRESHRLPTMTIDEYLEEERRQGNIITGGGQASYDAPTSSELLALATENDGTHEAEEAEEKKRLKEENWAMYTEANQKGAGNTINRG